jgi:hypothetical protein
MTAAGLAIASQIALLVYLELIEWVDLFPWNQIRHGNGQATLDIVLGLLMAGSILSTLKRVKIGMALGALVYFVWLALQIQSFWVPYFRGASPRWKVTYARFFADTVQIFPRTSADRLPPDASHFVLQVLIAVALVTTCAALARTASAGSPGSRRDPIG